MSDLRQTGSACRVFLLSPAHSGGRRASQLLRPSGGSPLAARLRTGTLTLGEAFSSLSGLYFRGKLAYAHVFGVGASPGPTSYVITPTRGLQTPDLPVSTALLEECFWAPVCITRPRSWAAAT